MHFTRMLWPVISRVGHALYSGEEESWRRPGGTYYCWQNQKEHAVYIGLKQKLMCQYRLGTAYYYDWKSANGCSENLRR